MATTFRRALLRLHQTLALGQPRPSGSLFRSHLGSISRFSSDHGSTEVDLSNEESKRRLYNRLLYRSRQRGFLELDLVLGNWVEENIRSMDERRIRALADVLDLEAKASFPDLMTMDLNPMAEHLLNIDGVCLQAHVENPDLWKWLTGQEQPPEAVNNNPVFTAVRSKVLGNLNSHAAPETRANPGQPWVRGWDDKGGQDGSPKYGNQ